MRKIVGFTMIEVLIVMGIIGIMASTLMFVIRPERQIAKAHDTQRETDLNAILMAVFQYQAEHSGALPDTDGNPLTSNFPSAAVCMGTNVGCFNIGAAGEVDETIVPVYLAAIPVDPKTGSDGNTGYSIYVDANNRLHASAVGEIENPITVTR